MNSDHQSSARAVFSRRTAVAGMGGAAATIGLGRDPVRTAARGG